MLVRALLIAFLIPASSLAQERLEIPAAGLSSSPAPLIGHLFAPRESGPRPAVVMMHGCGGAYARDGRLNARHQMWGEYLASKGYVALMVDSFTTRGVKELCTQKTESRTIKQADRVGDAHAALAYLRSRADVDPAKVSLLGWSNGGSTVLNAIAHAPANGPDFARAIAFYPGCTAFAKSPGDFHPYAPLLVLIGEADDWTPAKPCRELADIVRKRSEPMELVVYPGVYHDFDNPGITERVRTEVPNGVNPGSGVTVAPDAGAREDAKGRVVEFLKR